MITLHNVRVIFAAIYESNTGVEGARSRYLLAFEHNPEAESLLSPEGITPRWSREGALYYNASSTARPYVNADDYELLRQAFDLADMRNIGRDRLFKGLEVTAYVLPFAYDTQYAKRIGLALYGVEVRADRMMENAGKDY